MNTEIKKKSMSYAMDLTPQFFKPVLNLICLGDEIIFAFFLQLHTLSKLTRIWSQHARYSILDTFYLFNTSWKS